MSCLAVFCLANLYVSVELTQPRYRVRYNEGYWCTNHQCDGPLADVHLGMRINLDRVEIDYGLRHQSFPMEPYDKGQNGPFVRIEWRPFK